MAYDSVHIGGFSLWPVCSRARTVSSLLFERQDGGYQFNFRAPRFYLSIYFLLFFFFSSAFLSFFFFPLRGGDGGGGEGVFIPVQYLEFSDLSSIGINGIINSRICRRIASVANMVRNSDKSISISSRIKSIYIMNVYKKIGWLNFLLCTACRDGTESERTRNGLSFK